MHGKLLCVVIFALYSGVVAWEFRSLSRAGRIFVAGCAAVAGFCGLAVWHGPNQDLETAAATVMTAVAAIGLWRIDWRQFAREMLRDIAQLTRIDWRQVVRETLREIALLSLFVGLLGGSYLAIAWHIQNFGWWAIITVPVFALATAVAISVLLIATLGVRNALRARHLRP